MSDRRIGATTKGLLKAREWLQDKEHWCRGATMNLDGQTCLGGALVYKAEFTMIKDGPSPGGIACNLVEQAAQRLYNCDYVTVNDLMGYEAVMRVLDLAIRNSMEADNV